MKTSILSCLAALSVLASAFPAVHVNRRDNSTEIERPGAELDKAAVPDCIKWNKAESGHTCNVMGELYGVPGKKVQEWNHASYDNGPPGEDCSGVQVGYYYCVMTASYVPELLWPADCTKWHVAEQWDNCHTIGQFYNVPETKVIEWNVVDDEPGFCSEVLVGQSLCVMTASYVPETPADCNKWHTLTTQINPATNQTQTEHCHDLASKYGFDVETFIEWNPSVEEGCYHIIEGNTYCVGTESYVPKQFTPPGPVQPGQPKDCNDWRLVGGWNETTCNTLSIMTGVDVATLIELNPAVGPECTNMWWNYYMCIGTPTAGTGAPKPSASPSIKPYPETTTKPTKPNNGKPNKPTKPDTKPGHGPQPIGKPSPSPHGKAHKGRALR